MYATPLLPAISDLLASGDCVRWCHPRALQTPSLCRPGREVAESAPGRLIAQPPAAATGRVRRCGTESRTHCSETQLTPTVSLARSAPRAPPLLEGTVSAALRERIKPRTLAGELLAEFAGTMILLLFGLGVVAQVVAGQLGDHDSIAWAWGLGVVLGVYTAGRISGAHLNPAVTLSLAAFRGFPWARVVPFMLAQTAGAFVAALLVRWNYTEAL